MGRRLSLLRLVLVTLVLLGSLGSFSASSARDRVALPPTGAGQQLGWLLSAINGGPALNNAALRTHFSRAFLAALPADQLLETLKGYVAPNAPLAVARFAGPTDRDQLDAVLTTATGDWRVALGVEPGGSGKIDALFFEPVFVPMPAKPVKTWSDLLKRFKKIAPETSFTVAEITNGRCVPIASLNPDRELGIGSAFKLYVLGEIERRIAAGTLAWNQLVTVQANLRSLPNGDMRLAPAGAEYPLWYFVEQMISRSDNTATDHLIALLGRDAVERMMAVMGHSNSALNEPLLLTREWFAIKLRWTAREIENYLASSTHDKRIVLRTKAEADANTLGQDEQWPTPYLIDSIEWFASSSDLCRAMAFLHAQARTPALVEIHDALSIASGIDFDAEAWSYVGFKGGYETGVKSDVWILERADGRWFVVSAIINDPKAEIDGVSMHQLIGAAVGLLANV